MWHGVEQLLSPHGVLSNGLVLCIAGEVNMASMPAIDTSPLTNGLGLLGINDISSIFPHWRGSDARPVMLASRLAHNPGETLYANPFALISRFERYLSRKDILREKQRP